MELDQVACPSCIGWMSSSARRIVKYPKWYATKSSRLGVVSAQNIAAMASNVLLTLSFDRTVELYLENRY